MSGTQAITGYQTFLKRGDAASPENFTTIAEVRKLSAFGSGRDLLEATNQDSLNAFKEWINGLKDGVEFTAECNFLPTNATQSYAAGLIAAHNAGTRSNYQLALPSALGTFSFTALVKTWNINPEPNAVFLINFSFKITGPITFA